jgi:hypothetical protein
MPRAFVLLAATGLLGLGSQAAHAFTYDQHVYQGDSSANFSGAGTSSSSSDGFHFSVTGGDGSDGGAPANSPFLQSSNPSIGSPVVPYYGGAASYAPFPMAVQH